MIKRKDISIVEELAASQWGLFTTGQVAQHGVQRNQVARLVEKGSAEALSYSVYRLTSGDETSSVDIKAAWMSVFPKLTVAERMKAKPYDAVVAGRTAACLHGYGDFYASPYTFIVPARKQTTRTEIKYLLWDLDKRDIVFINGLPTTSIERTIADLIRLHEDLEHIDSFIVDAIQSGVDVDFERLAYLLTPLAARNGYARNDGEAFAKALFAKRGFSIQLERIRKQLESLGEATGNSERIKAALDSMKELTGVLAERVGALDDGEELHSNG